MNTDKFGVSIKGGLARSLGAIGVIKRMQELGFKPSVMAGSSFGGVVGLLYAYGYSYQDMLDIVKSQRIREFIGMFHFFKYGYLLRKDKLYATIDKYFGDRNFEDLETKVVLFATDQKTGERIFLDKGPIRPALIASCSYPFLVQPESPYQYLIDGDLSSSYSVEYLKSHVGKVIGVCYTHIESIEKEHKNLIANMTDILRLLPLKREHPDENVLPDIEIKYEASDFSYFDFKHIDKLVDRAYKAATPQMFESV